MMAHPSCVIPTAMPTPPPYVTFPRLGQLGRLGNQLFQMAATVGVATKNCVPYCLPPWPYARFLANPLPICQPASAPIRYIERSFAYQPIPITEPTALVGYFQSEKYFAHCTPLMRRLLTMRPDFEAALTHHCQKSIHANSCSIHVRRTDYISHSSLFD